MFEKKKKPINLLPLPQLYIKIYLSILQYPHKEKKMKSNSISAIVLFVFLIFSGNNNFIYFLKFMFASRRSFHIVF